jgi:hypothetical protein
MKNWIYIIFIFLLFNSCIDSLDKDLGDGYTLYIGDGYWTGILNSKNTVLISSKVLNYSYDSTFIIVSQRPWDSIPGIPAWKLKSMTPKEHEKAFKSSSFKQYWIINKNERSEFDTSSKTYSNVYGPYSKKEYFQKREKLGVPEKLKLDIKGKN